MKRSLLVVVFLWMVLVRVQGKRHKSDKTQSPRLVRAEERVEEALADWCRNGYPTKSTDECICATHQGFFCEGDECESGYGMSFFPKSCERCACKPDSKWTERKGALNSQRKKKKKGKKGKKNKKSTEPTDD